MRVIPRSVLLSLITLAVLPAWRSGRGQDSAIVTTVADAIQQPPQKPSNPTPTSQQTATPPAGAMSPSSTLDDSVNAAETDDDMEQPRRGMPNWNEYRGPYITFKAGLGFLVDT